MKKSDGDRKVAMEEEGPATTGVSRLETLPDALISKLRRQEFTIGETIGGRYRLKSLLGVGAMGQVFVAENTAISVDVAVKLLKPELIQNLEFRQRFQKEAEAIGSISHPNVARFFDLVVGDPTFLVMEYVRGPTLQQVIEQNTRLACGRALDIAVRLCWGLHAVHTRGIVHRDLKPANIVLGSDVEVGEQPVIIDFGLAKLATTETELTRSGQLIGTPEYMAPEQIEGKKIDARTDVYSLGCVLYKMIAGQAPFAGEDIVQVLYRQIHEKPRPLSKLLPEISPQVVDVLSRALAKNPADRFIDTREFARALGRAHERRRRSSSGLQTGNLPATPERRIPTALLVATTLAVGGVGGMFLARAKWSPSRAHDLIKLVQPAPVVMQSHDLFVVTSPEGATVEVDGKKQIDLTPVAIRGLEPGPHTLRLAAPGTARLERTITIPPTGRTALVVYLPSAQHDVIVRSMPSGATVYLDNQPAGTTPATIAVTEEDFHELRLERLGYAEKTQRIKAGDKHTEIMLSMEIDPSPHAEVTVDSNAEAEVWIDGVDRAVETPAMGIRVAPGHHTLQLRDSSGAASKRMTFESRPGETKRVVLNM